MSPGSWHHNETHHEHTPPISDPRTARLPRRRCRVQHRHDDTVAPQSTPPSGTPGAPPTFGTGRAPARRLAGDVRRSRKADAGDDDAAERQLAADSWRRSLAPYLERRTGPRKVALAATDTPATIWNPMLPGIARRRHARSIRPLDAAGKPLPASDDAIAFAPVTELSRWIESRQLIVGAAHADLSEPHRSARRKIRSVITLTAITRSRARRQADAEIAAGNTAARCTAFRTA